MRSVVDVLFVSRGRNSVMYPKERQQTGHQNKTSILYLILLSFDKRINKNKCEE